MSNSYLEGEGEGEGEDEGVSDGQNEGDGIGDGQSDGTAMARVRLKFLCFRVVHIYVRQEIILAEVSVKRV